MVVESRATVTNGNFLREGVKEEMEGGDGTCDFSAEGNEDTTMFVQIEET